MLPTAKRVKARVLIDPCSQVDLVSEGFVKKHKLVTQPPQTTIQGITAGDFSSSCSVSLQLKSRHTNYELELGADVIGQVPYTVDAGVLKKIETLDPELELADCWLPHSIVDILIGARYSNRILLGDQEFFGEFAFEKSQFDWVAEGPLNTLAELNPPCCNLTVVKVNERRHHPVL